MKQVVGMVVSNKMQKSVVVAVDRLFHHKLYNRYVKRTSKFMAHDEHDQCNIGDRVSFSLTKTQKTLFDRLVLIIDCLIDKIKSKIFRFDWTHQGHWARKSVGLLLKSLRKLEFINRLRRLPKPPLKHPLPPKVWSMYFICFIVSVFVFISYALFN